MSILIRFASCLARFGAALVVTALVTMGSGASAQELEPRAYTNTPVGLNFLLAELGSSQAWGPLTLEAAADVTFGAGDFSGATSMGPKANTHRPKVQLSVGYPSSKVVPAEVVRPVLTIYKGSLHSERQHIFCHCVGDRPDTPRYWCATLHPSTV